MRGGRRGRRWLAPEVVQSSAMDCGPAALACLLTGHRLAASYDRLREACHTDVDGTSIDDLEEVAKDLGLIAEQVMVPPDHLFLDEAATLPALLVVAGGGGATHFVVAWRRHRGRVQLMDPAVGRRWPRSDELAEELYLHTMPVPAAAWREWAASEDFLRPLAARLAALGVKPDGRRRWIDLALADASWRGAGTLDAAVRMVAALLAARAVRRGREAESVLETLVAEEAAAPVPQGTVPAAFWTVHPHEEHGQVLLRGAVLVRVRGTHEAHLPAGLSADLARAVSQPIARPFREMLAILGAAGRRSLGWLSVSFFLAAAGGVVEALLFRGLLDLPGHLPLVEQRAVAVGGILLFLVALLALDLANLGSALRAGRRLEVGLRLHLLDRLARVGERYLQSRLSSDMAERCHSVWKLRLTGELYAGTLRSGFALLLTAGGIAWLDPASAPLAVASAVVTMALPFAFQAPLAEREGRLRTHAGALGRFYLDALLGLVPLRNHVGEGAMRREHEGLLGEWVRAGFRLERGALLLDLVASMVGYGFAAWMLFRHLALGGGVAEVLLLAYWALNIPMRGQELAILGRQLPMVRTAAIRLLEPLKAPTENELTPQPVIAGGTSPPHDAERGAAVRFAAVSVVAGGHRILDEVDLAIAPGEHVAVVGRSGAGKSTLLGLLLGWHRAAAGGLTVDGVALDAAALDRLRQQTAWVDPAVRLWNRSLLDNVLYGTAGAPADVEGVLDAALLRDLLEALPQGWQTPLGEGGSLVSGGEGQRVRLARALARGPVRLALLDEPFRGLDRETRRRLLGAVRAKWRSATLLAVLHDLSDTAGFERVVVIEAGRVVEQGVPADLAADPGSVYARLLAAEREARERFDSPHWRHLRLEDGRLRLPSG
jgi:ABC-type bacteriocin/lantibiotic exporter with double-glycine peptidase domain